MFGPDIVESLLRALIILSKFHNTVLLFSGGVLCMEFEALAPSPQKKSNLENGLPFLVHLWKEYEYNTRGI